MSDSERPPGGEENGGMMAAGRVFVAACVQWAAARLRLISMEGKEAGARAVKLLLLVGALIVVAVFGWLFVCFALVFVLAGAIGGAHGLVWGALVLAGVHFVAVGALAFVLKGTTGAELFPLTVEELKKDQAWLESQKEKR